MLAFRFSLFLIAPVADVRLLPPPFVCPQDIKRWRESELTHGRVAMLAALG